jgi:UDP-N-acetylmuramoylalanine-D-glutamate ligase
MDTTALRGRTVLVVGEYRQTVTVVRSLHRAGMRVTFASCDPDSPTRRSRGVARWVRLEDTTAERFCDQLEARLRGDPHEFVFLVGIPTMFAASSYAFLELVKDGAIGSENWGEVGLAFAAATMTGFIVVKWLLGYIKSHRYTGFAFYRIVFGALLLLLMPAGS